MYIEEISMMQHNMLYITISHNLFINKLNRCKLKEDKDVSIDVTGVSIPVWCQSKLIDGKYHFETSEPAEEIFNKYILTNIKSDHVVEMIESNIGYKINISNQSVIDLMTDSEDDQNSVLTFTHYNDIDINGKSYKAIHFVSIRDEQALYDSVIN